MSELKTEIDVKKKYVESVTGLKYDDVMSKWVNMFRREPKEIMVLSLFKNFDLKFFKFLENTLFIDFFKSSFRFKIAFLKLYEEYYGNIIVKVDGVEKPFSEEYNSLFKSFYSEQLKIRFQLLYRLERAKVRTNMKFINQKIALKKKKDTIFNERSEFSFFSPKIFNIKNLKIEILRKDDYSGFDLGYQVLCCQRFNDAAETCIIAGYKKYNYSFLKISKNDKIIAHSLIFCKRDNIVIDSIETFGSTYFEDLNVAYKYIVDYFEVVYPKFNIIIGNTLNLPYLMENFEYKLVHRLGDTVDNREIYSDIKRKTPYFKKGKVI
jgi:hypothetical protein